MTALRVGPWGAVGFGRRFSCAIGRGGIVREKREGDGGTPVGRLKVQGLLYRPDRLPCPATWAEPILPGDLWCDESSSRDYNHFVRAPFAASHETLRRADPLYDAVLVTDWNWPEATTGCGSAIFLHIWRRPRWPTEGCIAFSRQDFLWLLPRLTPGSEILVTGQ